MSSSKVSSPSKSDHKANSSDSTRGSSSAGRKPVSTWMLLAAVTALSKASSSNNGHSLLGKKRATRRCASARTRSSAPISSAPRAPMRVCCPSQAHCRRCISAAASGVPLARHVAVRADVRFMRTTTGDDGAFCRPRRVHRDGADYHRRRLAVPMNAFVESSVSRTQ